MKYPVWSRLFLKLRGLVLLIRSHAFVVIFPYAKTGIFLERTY